MLQINCSEYKNSSRTTERFFKCGQQSKTCTNSDLHQELDPDKRQKLFTHMINFTHVKFTHNKFTHIVNSPHGKFTHAPADFGHNFL